jgi:hypothetical protein
LAVLPRHSDAIPSCDVVRRKHSMIPSYLRSRRPDLIISSCWNKSVLYWKACVVYGWGQVHQKYFLGSKTTISCRRTGWRQLKLLSLVRLILRADRLTQYTHLILDQQLNTFDGSCCGLRDGCRDTTHCEFLLASFPLSQATTIKIYQR